MKKTTIAFLSVASCIYYCFFFLSGSAYGDFSCRPHLTLVRLFDILPVICCHWLSPSIVNMVPLHSAVQLKQCRAGPNPSWGGGYYFLPGSFCSEVSGPPEQDDCCISGLAQHQIPVATCSVLYPKPLSPVSPQVSLVHSAPTFVNDLLSLATSFSCSSCH